MKKIMTILLNLLVAITGGGLLVCAFFSWQQAVLALTNNYTKNEASPPPANQITSTEWNNLSVDFVNQAGDVMNGSGNLDMGGHRITSLANPANGGDLANRQWTASEVASAYASFTAAAQDRDGNPLYIVCGQSGSTWVLDGSGNLYINVDTTGPAAGTGDPVFSGTPFYLISLGGDDRHFEPNGQSSIYAPSNTGFRVFLYKVNVNPALTPASVNAAHWHINWCGIGTIL